MQHLLICFVEMVVVNACVINKFMNKGIEKLGLISFRRAIFVLHLKLDVERKLRRNNNALGPSTKLGSAQYDKKGHFRGKLTQKKTLLKEKIFKETKSVLYQRQFNRLS